MTSHYTHAKKIFGIDEETLNSTPINPAVEKYIARQKKIYEDSSYFAVVGASYVDEKGSTGMMENYYKTLFTPYEDRYSSKEEFEVVSKYWTEHLNELEMTHAKDIKRGLLSQCLKLKDIEEMKRGCNALLDAQIELLDGVFIALKEAEKVGDLVPVNQKNKL
jgi:hypothetical protein